MQILETLISQYIWLVQRPASSVCQIDMTHLDGVYTPYYVVKRLIFRLSCNSDLT